MMHLLRALRKVRTLQMMRTLRKENSSVDWSIHTASPRLIEVALLWRFFSKAPSMFIVEKMALMALMALFSEKHFGKRFRYRC